MVVLCYKLSYFRCYNLFFFRMSSTLANDCGRSSQGKRSSVRKQWTSENMERAMKAVSDGMSITTASRTLAVPQKTLDDCVKARSKYSSFTRGREVSHRISSIHVYFWLSTHQNNGENICLAIAKRSYTDTRFNPSCGDYLQ